MIRDLVEKSRSWRGYDESRKVSREELLQLVDCARLTPSSVNRQPLRYYLACTPEQTAKIQPLTHWARALQPMQLPHPGHCPPAFIVICQDTNVDPSLERYQKDVGIVAQTMLLAATEKGLGGCMINNFSPKEMTDALQLKANLVPMLVVAIGKPDETIVLTDVKNGSTSYYRDENDVHYVPKRSLSDLVID
ncbi:MAG: nitroreductase family protein [Oscillospiraceae bacterium]|jgi:nitroreductase|nr:nitroreductase family protein [Oscillospiraceae bacterium]MDD3261686.1 nitroreductase family protein [Oscillospiraceae bacterium]